jgi:hypothetical protein
MQPMSALEKARSDENLAAVDPPWLRNLLRDLLRIEEKWLGCADSWAGSNDMPAWADQLWDNLLKMVGVRPPRLAGFGVEAFARLLGQKVAMIDGLEKLFAHREKTDDATRAHITVMLGGPHGVERMKNFRPLNRDVLVVARKTLKRMPRLPLEVQGQFYRGYGTGLMCHKQLRGWHRTKGERINKKAYKIAFAFVNWRKLEDLCSVGGWAAVSQFFVAKLPQGVEISEEDFVKTLKMAGMKSPRGVGRPRKSGSKS